MKVKHNHLLSRITEEESECDYGIVVVSVSVMVIVAITTELVIVSSGQLTSGATLVSHPASISELHLRITPVTT
jgi:hypothetical protein